MTSCSTHVLDSALGTPAAGLDVTLTVGDEVLAATTDADGRITWPGDLDGTVTLSFATGPWFAAADRATFYPSVDVTVALEPDRPHHHVALLLGPYSFTTYRGS